MHKGLSGLVGVPLVMVLHELCEGDGAVVVVVVVLELRVELLDELGVVLGDLGLAVLVAVLDWKTRERENWP